LKKRTYAVVNEDIVDGARDGVGNLEGVLGGHAHSDIETAAE
jgi:hypothetical protein